MEMIVNLTIVRENSGNLRIPMRLITRADPRRSRNRVDHQTIYIEQRNKRSTTHWKRRFRDPIFQDGLLKVGFLSVIMFVPCCHDKD